MSIFLRNTGHLAGVGQRSAARGRYQLHVLGQHASRVARRWRRPFRATRGDLGVVDVELDQPPVRIDQADYMDRRSLPLRDSALP